MYISKFLTGPGLALLAALALTAPAHLEAAEDTVYRLDNGMQVILKESHGAPMIASLVFVKSGSKYESEFENGITHFLEHLLFDGTANISREELDNAITDRGGYINAFTRQDATAYLVLLPKEYIEYGLTVQTDMLFNSTIPEAELPKERKVVIEEIRRSADAPGAPAEEFFTEKAYANTDYARPVLGYEPFISNIPRAAIIDYWKRYYTPENMITLVIGDFETSEMKKVVDRVFGAVKAQGETKPSDIHRRLAETKARAGQLTGQVTYDTVAAVKSTYVNLSIEAPPLSNPDYLAIDLLASYLALDEISPLKIALLSGSEPLATEAGVSLDTRKEFTRLEISAVCDDPSQADTVMATILSQLEAISGAAASPDVIQGIKTSVRCNDIYYAEKLHYYGFIIAPMLMTAGWDFVQEYPRLLDTVTWGESAAAAGRWFADPRYVATVVRPADTDQVAYEPEEMTAEEVIAHFDSAHFPSFDLVDGHTLTYPSTDSVSFTLDDQAVYGREVLPNGLTVLVKSGTGSQVFGVTVLGKNRSANEPEGQAGITDFVNRCLEKGTVSRDATRLASDLSAIGANLTLYDNPWIPYDDRYTTRQFSFLKFETIKPFAEEGLDLLCDILTQPAFDSTEVENVRNGMLGIIRRDGGSPSKVARNQFYDLLFGGTAFANPIIGTSESIQSISIADLKAYHHKYYSPENMIIAIACSRDTSEVMAWVRDRLGRLEPAGEAAATTITPSTRRFEQTARHLEMDKEQVAIYAGDFLPGADSDETVDLSVAASILSSRLYGELRERKGLAYSTGASIRFDRDFGWYYVSIATGAGNFREAFDGLTLQTDKLAYDGPRQEEINRARNRLWGRLMSAKLSRLNQAYYLALNDFLGRDPGYDRQMLEKLNKVDLQSVREAASRHFRTDTWAIGTAGKVE